MEYQELLELIRKNRYHLIAIDGRCGSGKTTLGNRLRNDLDCSLFHMDDFYIPWSRKTKERLDEYGGNVDYERFLSDVLSKLKRHEDFSYQIFDCNLQELTKWIDVKDTDINIVEGSYSMHDVLIDYYDLKIYVDCGYDIRIERLKKRNPDNINDFINMWIPLEDKYFDGCDIRNKADVIYDGND